MTWFAKLLDRLPRPFPDLARRLVDAALHFSRDDCGFRGAGIAFFAGLSLLPILLMLIAALGAFFELTAVGRNAEEAVLSAAAAHLSPALQGQTRELLSQVSDTAPLSGPVGIAVLLLSSLSGFVYLDRAFDRIGGAHRDEAAAARADPLQILSRFFRRRLTAFAILLALGFLIAASTTFDLVVEALVRLIPVSFVEDLLPFDRSAIPLMVSVVSPPIVNVGAVALLYRWVPSRTLSWRAAWWGAVLVAVLWEIGREVLALWLTSRGLESAYGVIGAFLVLQLWIYFGSMTLLYGAEFAYGFDAQPRADSEDPDLAADSA